MTKHLFFIAAIAVVGCVGKLEGIGPGTNPNPKGSGSEAQKLFETKVYPIIHKAGAASDCSACHDARAPSGNATGFVAGNVDDAYATITSFQSVIGDLTPGAAGILSRMVATDVHVTMRGRSYTAEEKQAISDWLAKELEERAGVPPSGDSGTTSARLLNQWTACMTLANWQSANMTTAWGNLQTDDGSTCRSCHATGGQGMMISNIETTYAGSVPGMWTVVSSKETYLVQYFSVDFTASTPQIIVNELSFQGVATGTPPHVEHPRFDPVNNEGMAALRAFYDLTKADLGSCMASGTKLNPPA